MDPQKQNQEQYQYKPCFNRRKIDESALTSKEIEQLNARRKRQSKSSNTYYLKNKDQLKKRRKEYYKNNNDQFKKRRKEYYENNKDQLKEFNKQYYQNNKDKWKQYNEKYYIKINSSHQLRFASSTQNEIPHIKTTNPEPLEEERKILLDNSSNYTTDDQSASHATKDFNPQPIIEIDNQPLDLSLPNRARAQK